MGSPDTEASSEKARIDHCDARQLEIFKNPPLDGLPLAELEEQRIEESFLLINVKRKLKSPWFISGIEGFLSCLLKDMVGLYQDDQERF